MLIKIKLVLKNFNNFNLKSLTKRILIVKKILTYLSTIFRAYNLAPTYSYSSFSHSRTLRDYSTLAIFYT